MFNFVRATGYAVASLIVVSSVTLAGPSLAWEVNETENEIPTFYDHAAAAPALLPETGAAAAFATPAFDPNLTQEVAEHAVAEVEQVEAAERRSLPELVAAHSRTDVPSEELECLAGAVY